MPWYSVTFMGLRKKPFTTDIEAESPRAARNGILSVWQVRNFISTKEHKQTLTPLQKAVQKFLRNPRKAGAVAALKKALEKDLE